MEQEQMLYIPQPGGPHLKVSEDNPEGYRSPAEHNLNFENVWITTKDDVKIHGWFVKVNASDYTNYRTIIFFHGNAGNIGLRMPNIRLLVEKLQCNVFIVDYRGFGESNGRPNEAGVKLDAEACLEWAINRKDIDSSNIYIFGRSLGGAVGIELAYN